MELALEYLKAVLTWPVAAVVIVLVLRSSIRDLLARIASVKFPGGELQTRQPVEVPAGQGQVNPPPAQLPAGVMALSQQDQQTLAAAFQAERAATRLWEYRFLNKFFVLKTQLVLDWFVGLGQVTTENAYHAYWAQFIPDGPERIVILDVLKAHFLVQPEGPILRASDKGREYVAWRGPVPRPPAVPPPPLPQ